MHRIILALALATASAAALAEVTTIRFGSGVVAYGDSMSKVRRVAGEPTRIVPIQNGMGASVGERWEYERRGKTILIQFALGEVSWLHENRE